MFQKRITLRGLNVSYSESSETSGDGPVLLIHGNSGCKEMFAPQIRSSLGKDLRLIGLDLPGHGQTDRDPRAGAESHVYTLRYYAEFVADFARALDLRSPVFVGHSLGGHIAIAASRLIPPAGL